MNRGRAATKAQATLATVVGLGAVLLALVASAQPAARPIRDVQPTTIEQGDTLVIECPGVIVGRPAVVQLTGLAGDRRITLARSGRAVAGDRVLVDIGAAEEKELGGRARLTGVTIDVGQQGDGETLAMLTWQTPPSFGLMLDLFPGSARRLAVLAANQIGTPPTPLVTALFILIVALVLHLLVAPLTGLLVVWERKISGRMQSRLGPNRVGPRGWLQWLADAIKLIVKEDLVPTEADRTLFLLSPYLKWMAVFATFVVLPLSEAAIVADMNIGLLYLLSVTSMTVIGILMGGWASNSKWALLGGMRSAAQIVSYEVPAAMALLQIALLAGTLSPQGIVRAQGGLPHQWFVFANPVTFVCFFIYFVAALAEGNRTPFDLPEAESELVAGYTTEYSGFRFSVFSLAEWTNMYVVAAIASAGFLGGWNIPFVTPAAISASWVLQALSLAVMVSKVVALVFVIIWIRWTLPRFRIDQLMTLCWKYLVPMSFAAFLLTAGWLTISGPTADLILRWVTFAVGGVGLGLIFLWRTVWAFRRTKLLYVGDKQFTLPFLEPPIDRR